LTLIELASQLKRWRGPYLEYAFAVSAPPIPVKYWPHLDRAIARRSGVSSTDGLSESDPKRRIRTRVLTAYIVVTKRRRDALADYWLERRVHDALQGPGVTVSARNAAGAIEVLRPVDIGVARIDLAANTVTVGNFVYTHVQVDQPAAGEATTCVVRTGAQPSISGSDTPSTSVSTLQPGAKAKGGNRAINDDALIAEMREHKTNGAKSWREAARRLVDEGRVPGGGTPDSKIRRLASKAAR
jgi:hypothetical protein